MAEVDTAVPAGTTSPHIGGNDGFACLPGYTRSLLKIELPVSVTLATKQMPLQQIVELVAGSIIQFDKQCDEPLTLEVGERSIAVGEAVKVGDKFGVRLTSITRGGERYRPVQGRKSTS